MTGPLFRLVPHGERGHFESRACSSCRPFLDELAALEREMFQLCALGLAEVVSTDQRGERNYRLTSKGLEWLECHGRRSAPYT